MTISFICGFETGDASEIATLGGGASIQGTTVRTGGYALKNAGTNSSLIQTLSTTQSVCRFYLQVPALPGANTVIWREQVGGTNRFQWRFNVSNKLEVFDAAATLGLTTTAGTASFNTGQWYRIETAIDLAASGVVKVWVDGVLDINVTHTSDVTASPTTKYLSQGAANPNEYFFDDIRIDSGTVTPPGAAQIIARQGKAGTPTYDAWTKNGAATAALCWSDTPFSTATNCSDNVLNDAQTMLVEKFSITQAGHGTQVISALDTINACKAAIVAKTAIAGNLDIRRRVGGVDTNVTVALTTSDKYFDTGIFTDSVANLDAYEIGVANDLIGTLETVEDAWLIVDYTPAIQLPLDDQYAQDLPQPRRYPLENRSFVHQFDVSLLQGKDKFYGPIGMAVPVLDWEVPPPLRRSRALMDPQNQYVRIVGQESGFTKFVPDLTLPPPPARRQRALDSPQAQRAEYTIGRETLPNFVANLDRPAAQKRLDMHRDTQAQYVRVVGQETLPGFTQEWKVPPPKVVPMENKGFIKDLDIQLLGQDQTPAFSPEWKVPPPAKRTAALVETDAPAHPLWLRIGSETLPGFNAEWKVPPPVKRQATVIDPQNQYPRIVGQETLPGFVPDQRVVPPPAKRVSTLGEPQSQYVRIVGQETLPGFVPDQRVVPPPAKRGSTIGEVQSQYVRIVGQETLPKSNLDWKIPAPRKTPMEILWVPTRAILSSSFTQAASATVALAGAVTRAIARSDKATIPVVGAVIRAIAKAISGVSAVIGAVTDNATFHSTSTAVVGAVGSVLFAVGVVLTTALRAVGTVFFWVAEKTISTIWTDEPGDEE